MDKNLPANAGDTGLIPDLGRFHMPWSSKARVSQLLSPCTAATEKPVHLEPVLCNKRSHSEKTPMHGNEEQPPLAATRGSLCAPKRAQSNQINK